MQTYTWYIISYFPANSRSARVGGLLYCGVSRWRDNPGQHAAKRQWAGFD